MYYFLFLGLNWVDMFIWDLHCQYDFWIRFFWRWNTRGLDVCLLQHLFHERKTVPLRKKRWDNLGSWLVQGKSGRVVRILSRFSVYQATKSLNPVLFSSFFSVPRCQVKYSNAAHFNFSFFNVKKKQLVPSGTILNSRTFILLDVLVVFTSFLREATVPMIHKVRSWLFIH